MNGSLHGVMKRFLYVLHQGVCKNAEPQDPFPGTLSLGISKPPGYIRGQFQEKAGSVGRGLTVDSKCPGSTYSSPGCVTLGNSPVIMYHSSLFVSVMG